MITLTTIEALSLRNWLWQLSGYLKSNNQELATRILDLGNQLDKKIREALPNGR